jgi:hypothetical protein
MFPQSSRPWVECPVCDLDFDAPPLDRYATLAGPMLDNARRLLAAVVGHLPEEARRLADQMQRTTRDRFAPACHALASMVGADPRDVWLANVSYDVLLALLGTGQLGCSTIALATPDGPVLARNMDWWPELLLARASCTIRYWQRGILRMAHAGWPGALGVVTGLSARGFAVALNAVLCNEPIEPRGYPVLLWLRCVLEDATSFDEALAMLRDELLAASALFTLVGREGGQRVVIERTPRRHALRWPQDTAPLAATNDYQTLDRALGHASLWDALYGTTCRRYSALMRRSTELPPGESPSDEQLLDILTDPQVLQTITAQHVVVRPATGSIRLWVPRRLAAVAR